MRLAVFILMFLLTPILFLSAEEVDSTSSPQESQNVCLFAVPKSFVTLPDISFGGIKEKTLELVKSTQEKADGVAVALADKLEETKIIPDISASVAGASTVGSSDGETEDSEPGSGNGTFDNMTAAAYNAGVDVLAFLLRHWLWTLSGLGALALFWTFKT